MVEYKYQVVTFRNKEYKLTYVQVSIMIVDTVTDEEIAAFPNLSLLPTQSFFNIFKMFASNIRCDSVCLPLIQVALCYLSKHIHWTLMQFMVH